MFQSGDVVDERYDILGPLGQGGMAHVFKARDRHLDRPVALKALRPHLTEADSERFRREIRTLATLSHPGIASIYDLSGGGQGAPIYFTMELIEGGPFTELGPYEEDLEPAERLLGAAITVAEALDYIHRLGLVHRDVTPRNILLTGQGAPKVMDFGLVQLAETSRQLTRTGITLGTPQYMAPEQATGGATGAATDLYAFGAVLYRAVTGTNPFDAENDQAVLYQHVYGDVASARELNPAVPEELAQLIARLLEKRPSARPTNGGIVADALRSVLATCRRRLAGAPGGGPARRGYGPDGPTAGPLRSLWSVRLERGPQWPAGLAAGEGFVFAGLRSDELAVLRPADGGVHLRLEAPDEIAAPPLLLRSGHLLVTSRDGSLRAFAWPRGDVAWRRDGIEATGALGIGGDALVASRDGWLERCDPATGEARWRYSTGSACGAAFSSYRDAAFVATRDGWLHAVDLRDGGGRFRIETGPVVAAPSAADGVLLIPEREGALHAFDLEQRDVRWTYDFGGELWATPAIWSGRVYAASWGETLRCLSLRSGDDLWEQPLGAPTTAPPTVAGGVVYVGTEAGELCAFDARDGATLGRMQVAHAPVQAAPLAYGGRVLVAAVDGTLSSFG